MWEIKVKVEWKQKKSLFTLLQHTCRYVFIFKGQVSGLFPCVFFSLLQNVSPLLASQKILARIVFLEPLACWMTITSTVCGDWTISWLGMLSPFWHHREYFVSSPTLRCGADQSRTVLLKNAPYKTQDVALLLPAGPTLSSSRVASGRKWSSSWTESCPTTLWDDNSSTTWPSTSSSVRTMQTHPQPLDLLQLN